MNRAEALAFLNGEFSALGTKAGLTNTDTDAGWKAAIDAALRDLGVARADLQTTTIAASLDADFEALLRYWALQRVRSSLAAKEDVKLDGPGIDVKRSQLFKQVEPMLAEYRLEVEALGYGGAGASIGRLTLDFLEPVRT